MEDRSLFFDPDAPVQANQYAVEFKELLRLVEAAQVSKVLEIGTFLGGSLYQWLRRMMPGGLLVAVDLPGATWGMPDTASPDAWRQWGIQKNIRVFPVLADSHNPQTVSQVHNFAPFDLVFIDGDHSYEGAKKDWDNYRYMVRKGGMVVFHDILQDPSRDGIGVWQLWQEISGIYRSLALTSFGGQSEKGIGVIWL